LLGDAVECFFAAVEYDYCDAAAGNAGEYGGYCVGLYSGAGFGLYGYGKCDGTGWGVCGSQGDGREWDGRGCLDGADV
jgi:hypothetical protein